MGLGSGDTSHIEMGERVMCASWIERWRRGLSGRENGRWAGTGGDQTGAEKRFTCGRGCANLHRGVPGRGMGVDVDRRKR